MSKKLPQMNAFQKVFLHVVFCFADVIAQKPVHQVKNSFNEPRFTSLVFAPASLGFCAILVWR